jgi:YesN/AraC family two-component response regulator
MDGLELLKKIKEAMPQTAVIIFTGKATVQTAIEALKNGAYDYILKPFDIHELTAVVRRCLDHARLQRQEKVLRETVYLYQLSQEIPMGRPQKETLEFILSQAMKALKAEGGSLFMYLPSDKTLQLTVSMGSAQFVEETLRAGERVAGWVAQYQRALLIQGPVNALPEFRDITCRDELCSSLVSRSYTSRRFSGYSV